MLFGRLYSFAIFCCFAMVMQAMVCLLTRLCDLCETVGQFPLYCSFFLTVWDCRFGKFVSCAGFGLQIFCRFWSLFGQAGLVCSLAKQVYSLL